MNDRAEVEALQRMRDAVRGEFIAGGPPLSLSGRVLAHIDAAVLALLARLAPPSEGPHTRFEVVKVGPRGEQNALRCLDCGAVGAAPAPPSEGLAAETIRLQRDEIERLRRIEAAAREELRTRDEARIIAGRHAEAGHLYTDPMPDLEAATAIATDAEDALRAALTPAEPSAAPYREDEDEALYLDRMETKP